MRVENSICAPEILSIHSQDTIHKTTYGLCVPHQRDDELDKSKHDTA